ncbi:hypothetical protein PPYR_00094 [Photinus pyralis]|uniref:Uncharacterized protein n=1 Tax=Photinus pyralis TaxID=7054 RepID=A0A1Y1KGE9_PHOPY|nr:uncharacterized protein LOC116173870 [Photinus pyralis]KAB0803124.1 hypothetical protein PPYR_00094 [Photinus pyralis]
MNTFSAICLLLCASQTMGHLQFSEEELKCIKDLNLDKNYIESIITDDSSKFIPEDDPKFNLFLNCYWKAIEFQNEDGTFNFDKLEKEISTFTRKNFGGKPNDEAPIGLDIANAAVASCKNVPAGVSHGQTAARVKNCIDKRLLELIEKKN